MWVVRATDGGSWRNIGAFQKMRLVLWKKRSTYSDQRSFGGIINCSHLLEAGKREGRMEMRNNRAAGKQSQYPLLRRADTQSNSGWWRWRGTRVAGKASGLVILLDGGTGGRGMGNSRSRHKNVVAFSWPCDLLRLFAQYSIFQFVSFWSCERPSWFPADILSNEDPHRNLLNFVFFAFSVYFFFFSLKRRMLSRDKSSPGIQYVSEYTLENIGPTARWTGHITSRRFYGYTQLKNKIIFWKRWSIPRQFQTPGLHHSRGLSFTPTQVRW